MTQQWTPPFPQGEDDDWNCWGTQESAPREPAGLGPDTSPIAQLITPSNGWDSFTEPAPDPQPSWWKQTEPITAREAKRWFKHPAIWILAVIPALALAVSIWAVTATGSSRVDTSSTPYKQGFNAIATSQQSMREEAAMPYDKDFHICDAYYEADAMTAKAAPESFPAIKSKKDYLAGCKAALHQMNLEWLA
jgi:hypothetical protein